MNYYIDANFEKLIGMPKTSATIFSQNELFDFSCKIEIDFHFKGNLSKYDNDFVRMYLFLHELHMFITDLQQNTKATWFMGYAPFANGILENGSILISSKRGKQFYNNIYDEMDNVEANKLKRKIENDMKHFYI